MRAGLIAVICLALPGCITWNTGERIRQAKVELTAADAAHPLRGVMYECREDTADYYYVQAPVVTYHERSPLIQMSKNERATAVDVRPTGALQWVRVRNGQEISWGELLPEPPLNPAVCKIVQEKEQGGQEAASTSGMIVMGRRNEDGHAMSCVLAAPFDFLIDPVLIVTSTAAVAGAKVVGATAYGLGYVTLYPFGKAFKALVPEKTDDEPMPEPPVVMP